MRKLLMHNAWPRPLSEHFGVNWRFEIDEVAFKCHVSEARDEWAITWFMKFLKWHSGLFLKNPNIPVRAMLQIMNFRSTFIQQLLFFRTRVKVTDVGILCLASILSRHCFANLCLWIRSLLFTRRLILSLSVTDWYLHHNTRWWHSTDDAKTTAEFKHFPEQLGVA